MPDLSLEAALSLLASTSFNLLKMTADGALVMSVDRWRLRERRTDAIVLAAEPPAGRAKVPPSPAEPLVIALDQIVRLSWDRLPRQQSRAQVRLHLRNGDRWTFSGHLPEAMEQLL